MKKLNWQPADWGYLILVTLPPLILAGLFVVAAIDWRIESARLDESITTLVGEEGQRDADVLAHRYDAMTSREQTPQWTRILAATKALHAKYGGPFIWQDETKAYEQLVPPEEDWPVAEVLARYGQDARPILAEMETLLASDDTIWLPIVFDSFDILLPSVNDMRGVARLLRYTFLDAIHRGDHERALMNVRLMQRLFGDSYEPIVLIDELVRMACYRAVADEIRSSLAYPIWSESELVELESLLARSVDWDRRWEMTLRSESFMWLPWIADPDGFAQIPVDRQIANHLFWSFAPSTGRALVDLHLSLISLRGAGSRAHVERVEKVNDSVQLAATEFSFDGQLQIPTLSNHLLLTLFLPAHGGFATALAREANSRRFTRLTLALRMFEHRFGHWPNRLEELEQVGVSRAEITAYDGGTFAYEAGPEDRVTLYNQANKDAEYRGFVNPAESIELRPSTR